MTCNLGYTAKRDDGFRADIDSTHLSAMVQRQTLHPRLPDRRTGSAPLVAATCLCKLQSTMQSCAHLVRVERRLLLQLCSRSRRPLRLLLLPAARAVGWLPRRLLSQPW